MAHHAEYPFQDEYGNYYRTADDTLCMQGDHVSQTADGEADLFPTKVQQRPTNGIAISNSYQTWGCLQGDYVSEMYAPVHGMQAYDMWSSSYASSSTCSSISPYPAVVMTSTRRKKPAIVDSDVPRVSFASLGMHRDDIDTEKLSNFLLNEMTVCGINQSTFAAKILGRSQGTLSELLRRPKKWDMIKNTGRVPYQKMFDWLCLDDNERMRALEGPDVKGKRKPHKEHTPRVVFTDIQRKTLKTIFESCHAPEPEYLQQIGEHLRLKPHTVNNFFTNSRRRLREGKMKPENEENQELINED
ncbi:unnamed protein product [Caenorhabditis sp. 36 PRJEB53466]|nr:unnamed protein product [Caenorhabditis sp. 36 PRJEB53466]